MDNQQNNDESQAEITLKFSEKQQIAWGLLTDKDTTEIVYGGSGGGGKMLSVDTPIPTPTGWKLNGDLVAGDELFTADGTITRVLVAHPIQIAKTYRVWFDDHTYIDACADHLWQTFTRKEISSKRRSSEEHRAARRLKRTKNHDERYVGLNLKEHPERGYVRTTSEIFETQEYRRMHNGKLHIGPNHLIFNTEPLNLPDVDLLIEPYLLGAWLGDGKSSGGRVHGIDDEVFQQIQSLGYELGEFKYEQTGDSSGRMIYGLQAKLRSLNLLKNKHIPAIYLRSSIEQRIELIRGLMDTDGSASKDGGVHFSNTNKEIINGMYEVLVSLGCKVYIVQREKSKRIKPHYKTYWQLEFIPWFDPFHLSRKSDRFNAKSKTRPGNKYRYITKVEKIPDVEMRCLTVEHPSHLYLAGKQMVPTHNTALTSLWMVLECVNNPGIKIALGREELLRLKQTTLATIIGFAHKVLGVEMHDYNFNGSTNTLTYSNGSLIQLLHMAYSPQDPNYDTLGSLDFTHVVIEEAGEVREKAKAVLGSRRNRWKNDEYGITGKLVMTCNPSKNFLYTNYYTPYHNLGGGAMQRWPKGKIFYDGEWHQAYHAFVKALVTDNPFISPNYIETLRGLPTREKKRLLLGDWEFDKNTDGMFDDTVLRPGLLYGTPPQPGESPIIAMGVDVADTGKDSTIVTISQNDIAIRQVRLVVDQQSSTTISDQQAEQIIALATQYGLTSYQAQQIAVEINGVGVGVRDAMKRVGWYITEYQANGTSRSQGFYDLMTDMRDGKFRVAIDAMQFREEILRQLSLYSVEMDSKLKPKVTPKDKIKDEIGHSPDESDSLMICNWVRRGSNLQSKSSTYKPDYDYARLGDLAK